MSQSPPPTAPIAPHEAEDAAIAWIARLRSHDVTQEDRRRFAVWLAEQPAHRRAFDRMTELWERLAIVDSIDGGAAVARRSQRRWMAPLALAAALILGVGVWLQSPTTTEIHETARGGQQHVTLTDGSRIDLNTDSRIEVRMEDKDRHVRLTHGEAYFEVSPDPNRPFTVATRDGTVRVLGTAFLVRVGADETLVGVASGRVGVVSNGATSEIGPGQSVVLTDGIEAAHVDPATASSWRSGQLVYDGVTLAELITDMNRYVKVPMSLASPQLADERVSAVVTIGDQEAMLEALGQTLPLRWRLVSDRLIVIQARDG